MTTSWAPDILGDGYLQHTIDLGADPDGEGTVTATLVKLHTTEAVTGSVLYVHGFTDYFFQTALAEHFAALGLAFYAVDLRKCGRSRAAGQTAHYVSHLNLYDSDLEDALAVIKAEHPGLPTILVAHSTGGLIVPLWLARKKPAGVAGVVLNSPWLDMQGKALVTLVGTPIIKALSSRKPFAVLKGPGSAYAESLHKDHRGEWDFDLGLKNLTGFPATVGWLAAVRRGHDALHKGLDLPMPILALRSSKSWFTPTYTPEIDAADTVLDVKQIARWSSSLGRDVTALAIPGARHDVFLSTTEPREKAYAEVTLWLRTRVLTDA